jgi:hypothetical protein
MQPCELQPWATFRLHSPHSSSCSQLICRILCRYVRTTLIVRLYLSHRALIMQRQPRVVFQMRSLWFSTIPTPKIVPVAGAFAPLPSSSGCSVWRPLHESVFKTDSCSGRSPSLGPYMYMTPWYFSADAARHCTTDRKKASPMLVAVVTREGRMAGLYVPCFALRLVVRKRKVSSLFQSHASGAGAQPRATPLNSYQDAVETQLRTRVLHAGDRQFSKAVRIPKSVPNN